MQNVTEPGKNGTRRKRVTFLSRTMVGGHIYPDAFRHLSRFGWGFGSQETIVSVTIIIRKEITYVRICRRGGSWGIGFGRHCSRLETFGIPMLEGKV